MRSLALLTLEISRDLARSRAISQALDASFGGTREGQFLEKITKAFENLDADAFTEVAATFLIRQLPNEATHCRQVVREYDEISRLATFLIRQLPN